MSDVIGFLHDFHIFSIPFVNRNFVNLFTYDQPVYSCSKYFMMKSTISSDRRPSCLACNMLL